MNKLSILLVAVAWCCNMMMASPILIKTLNERLEQPVENIDHTSLQEHRAKRAATDNCTVPSNWPTLVQGLNTILNSTLYLGLSPQQPNMTALPTSQPTTCPTTNGSWWPGVSENLRSTCPWTYNYTDIGESFYPRYVQEAVCLCSTCVNANVMGCKYLRQNITVFQRVACKNGLAIMNAVTKNIAVGCYCATNPVQPSGGSGGPTATE